MKFANGQQVLVKDWNSISKSFVQRPARIIGSRFWDGDIDYEVHWLDVDPANRRQSQTQGSLRAHMITAI